jgi:hypothetical protein
MTPRASTRRHPWYDSIWLDRYVRARELIRRVRPEKLGEFERAFDRLKTRPDFHVQQFPRVFPEAVHEQIKQTIRSLRRAQLELHEIRPFGRFVVHDDPFFTELQQTTVDLVSQAVGEPVEPSYNFLSMYTRLGVCPVHMDAPEAKWTLDVCIDQSEPWPIQFSQVLPWPEDFTWEGDDWEQAIKTAPQHRFTSCVLEPGQAVVFSGSSQWHYRDAKPPGREHFCHLLFFHFIPRGMRAVLRWQDWPGLFDIPELAEVVQGENER